MFINWSPMRKLIWLKASGGLVPDLPWQTFTGNPLSFIARTAHALKSCVVGIEPVQNLNGQANPYPAGGGKNKFDQATMSDYSNYTIPIGNTYHYTDPVILKPNTTYTFKATDTTSVESGTYYVLTVVNGDDPTATSDMAYLYPVYNGTVSSPQANRTFTTGATGAIRFGVRNATYLGYVMAKTWQLEEGSSSSDYAPYSNICPISGFTGANVTRTGKNLFGATINQGSLSFSSGALNDAANRVRSDKFPIKAGTYTIQNGTGFEVTICAFDENDAVLASENVASWKSNPHTFTITNAKSVIFVWRKADNANIVPSDISNIQLESGSPATTYEAYNGTTYSVTWNTEAGTVYGGTLDVTTGVLTVDRVGITESSSTGWTGDSGGQRAYKAFTGIKPITAATQKIDAISNYLVAITTQQGTQQHLQGMYFGANNSENVSIHIDGVTDKSTAANILSALNTYFSDNPLQVVYKLATPQTYQLTAQEVSAIVGQNTMWTDCATLTVEAKAMD